MEIADVLLHADLVKTEIARLPKNKKIKELKADYFKLHFLKDTNMQIRLKGDIYWYGRCLKLE